MSNKKIPVEVSARHIHLSQTDLDKLFGKNYQLKKLKQLSQPEEFAAKETVTAYSQSSKKNNSKEFTLRIVGPVRKESQIEISRTEAIKLKIDAPLKLSGDLKNVKTKLFIKAPKGTAQVKTIVAKRHLHISSQEAKKRGLKKGQKVKVQIQGERGLIFENVIVRPGKNYCLACHIDTDEANSCGLGKVCGLGSIILK